jgi:hypothetical protein
MTGKPAACASTTALPNVSVSLGKLRCTTLTGISWSSAGSGHLPGLDVLRHLSEWLRRTAYGGVKVTA